MAKKSENKVSILQTLHDDYGLLAQEQDPAKVIDVLRRLADGIEKKQIGILGFTYGFTTHIEDFPRAVIDLDFIEHVLITEKRADAPKAPKKEAK